MIRILSVDIGGTNTRFSQFTATSGAEPILVETVWMSSKQASFGRLLANLEDSSFGLRPFDADLVVIAVAGSVEHGTYAKVTNSSWAVDLQDPELSAFADRVVLINDFTAQVYGCLSSTVLATAHVLQPGTAEEHFPLAAIGAGTGLGVCSLVPVSGSPKQYIAVASEGGHAPMAFITPREVQLQEFIQRQTGYTHAFGDTVVTGLGLTFLHWFLTGRKLEPRDVAAEIGPESETTAWFARFYGRAARAYALYVLPRAGLFVCGGLAAKNPHFVTHPEFLREFTDCPAHGALLARIPVSLVTSQETGLYGAARFGISWQENKQRI